MNTKRAAGWAGFLDVAAALAWLPGYWMPAEEGDETLAVTATTASGNPRVASPDATGKHKAAVIKDLSPAGDLFTARTWKAAPTLASVVEQPVNMTPVVQAPTVPPMPFQFVGRLDDRSDLQVFLQSGEKYTSYAKGM